VIQVRLTPLAEHDVSDAYIWYDAKREGLGLEFLDRVDQAIQKIAENPTLYAPIIDDARRVLLEQFPYGLWYTVNDDAVVIGCIHHKRHETLARKRVRQPDRG
jgi:plasmid stabilization system protein ParE